MATNFKCYSHKTTKSKVMKIITDTEVSGKQTPMDKLISLFLSDFMIALGGTSYNSSAFDRAVDTLVSCKKEAAKIYNERYLL